MGTNAYYHAFDHRRANHAPLSPLSFLERAAKEYPDQISIIYGATRYMWAQTYVRCRRLASALTKRGVRAGDTVATLLPNTPAMFEAHFGVPMAGAVLNTLNTRLGAEAIAFMLEHGEARVLLCDPEFSATASRALGLMRHRRPIVINVEDTHYQRGLRIGELDYERFLSEGDPQMEWSLPSDEGNPIALNYASSADGSSRGVLTHHRGAYLSAVSNVLAWSMQQHPIYLWTLPMFHCNGWCFPWTMALQAGTNVCLRRLDPCAIFAAIRKHRVTHMCGAPVVYDMLVNAPASLREGIAHSIQGQIAGATPPGAIIEGCERIGIELTRVSDLAEVYGPAAVCARQRDWARLSIENQARLNARQSVASSMLPAPAMPVVPPVLPEPVWAESQTIAEVLFREVMFD